VKSGREACSPFSSPLSKRKRTMSKPSTHLLVVDDDPVALNLLKEVLSQEGYEVSTALSGEEAIALGADRLFDVVITDVRMGTKTGWKSSGPSRRMLRIPR